MKKNILYLITILLFLGCSKEPTMPISKPIIEDPIITGVVKAKPEKITFETMPNTEFIKSSFEELPDWESEDYIDALNSFVNSCNTIKTKSLYKELCQEASRVNDAKSFFIEKFSPYQVDMTNRDGDGLLTGYYEPLLRGSLSKKEPYIYPVYSTPRDLLVVNFTQQYPELKNYRLRGRKEGNKVVPYYSRKELSNRKIDADIVCYVDSRIDLFFLEVQGSGRVLLDSGEVIYVGFDNLNGHKYSSIGKYLINAGEMSYAEASMSGIKNWCDKNPSRVDELLHHNDSKVFFKKRAKPASGALGIVLTPKRSVAVDQSYLPLGSMLYMSADTKERDLNRIVIAQDTGGAIKGSVRADLFFGYGDEAGQSAGKLKAPLKLWILLPKKES
ncbi:MltA [Sulfurimonas denitrificans DSM 1251]|uniref:peptidoglycan lytic exotransglycosylase n=1 Tax=Sulfurimonas denitrificans (strain ATCC 33889 / DSM 1251) TaxID=326298 RepID=Q30R18_SULDN|nr:murein transglycosylase A [Sulfurimonas denitrificans]ABB44563.1 MltA [Sulfurimonas denitrificans DSM 1251]